MPEHERHDVSFWMLTSHSLSSTVSKKGSVSPSGRPSALRRCKAQNCQGLNVNS